MTTPEQRRSRIITEATTQTLSDLESLRYRISKIYSAQGLITDVELMKALNLLETELHRFT